MAAAIGNTNAICRYKPEFCQLLIDHMSEGYSFESFSAIISVGRKTTYNWCKDYPDFAEAKEIAEGKALKYFETAIKSASMSETIDDKILQQKFDPKKINVPTMQWFIKCRFHSVYSEKNITVIEGGENPIQINHTHRLDQLTLEELKQLKMLKEKLEPITITV